MFNDRDAQNYAVICTLWKEIFGEEPTFENRTDIESTEAILYLLMDLGISVDEDFVPVMMLRKSHRRPHPWCQAARILIIQMKNEPKPEPIAISTTARRCVDTIKTMLAKKPKSCTQNEWLVALCLAAHFNWHYSGMDEQWIKKELENQCCKTETEKIKEYWTAYEIYKEIKPGANEKRPSPCIQYNRLLTLFIGYVNNDLESADPNYVREVLFDNLGMTEDEARACGFEHLIISQGEEP